MTGFIPSTVAPGDARILDGEEASFILTVGTSRWYNLRTRLGTGPDKPTRAYALLVIKGCMSAPLTSSSICTRVSSAYARGGDEVCLDEEQPQNQQSRDNREWESRMRGLVAFLACHEQPYGGR